MKKILLTCTVAADPGGLLFGYNTAFIGNIDPSGVLALGTPEDVRKKTLELLDIYLGKGRFILNADCAIPPDTASENLLAMIDTARNYIF